MITIKAKRVIFQILILIMKADLVTKDEEIEFLDRVFKEFELSIDEFDHMENIDADSLIKEFALLSCDTKTYARKLFFEMAQCDGFVDPRELSIINRLT